VSEGESGVPPHGRADDLGGIAVALVQRVTSGRSRHHLILQPCARSTCQCLLGCAILSIEGGEIMSMLQIAMTGGLRYPQVREAVFAHPTLAESLNNVFYRIE